MRFSLRARDVRRAATGIDVEVMEQMRATPVNDFFAKNGKIRIVHDMYLFAGRKPEESKGDWDPYKLIATVPGDEAFRPLDKAAARW